MAPARTQRFHVQQGRAAVTTCSFDGCGLEAKARGLCGGHYQQWYRGSPLAPLGEHMSKRPRCSVKGCRKAAGGDGTCGQHPRDGGVVGVAGAGVGAVGG